MPLYSADSMGLRLSEQTSGASARWRRTVTGVIVLAVLGPFDLQPARADSRSCSISIGSVAFGSYDVFAAAATTTTASIAFACKGGTAKDPIRINLVGGSFDKGTRYLSRAGSADRLSYSLYMDAAHQTVWGDGSNGSGSYPVPATAWNAGSSTVNVFATIPPLQNVAAGTYSDAITAEIDY